MLSERNFIPFLFIMVADSRFIRSSELSVYAITDISDSKETLMYLIENLSGTTSLSVDNALAKYLTHVVAKPLVVLRIDKRV